MIRLRFGHTSIKVLFVTLTTEWEKNGNITVKGTEL